jgi:hypothetical protein
MTYTKSDGTIEIQGSGCCYPPEEQHKGQHTNSTTNWIRFNEGKWHRLHSLTWAMRFATNSKTVEECKTLILLDEPEEGVSR